MCRRASQPWEPPAKRSQLLGRLLQKLGISCRNPESRKGPPSAVQSFRRGTAGHLSGRPRLLGKRRPVVATGHLGAIYTWRTTAEPRPPPPCLRAKGRRRRRDVHTHPPRFAVAWTELASGQAQQSLAVLAHPPCAQLPVVGLERRRVLPPLRLAHRYDGLLQRHPLCGAVAVLDLAG